MWQLLISDLQTNFLSTNNKTSKLFLGSCVKNDSDELCKIILKL